MLNLDRFARTNVLLSAMLMDLYDRRVAHPNPPPPDEPITALEAIAPEYIFFAEKVISQVRMLFLSAAGGFAVIISGAACLVAVRRSKPDKPITALDAIAPEYILFAEQAISQVRMLDAAKDDQQGIPG